MQKKPYTFMYIRTRTLNNLRLREKKTRGRVGGGVSGRRARERWRREGRGEEGGKRKKRGKGLAEREKRGEGIVLEKKGGEGWGMNGGGGEGRYRGEREVGGEGKKKEGRRKKKGVKELGKDER